MAKERSRLFIKSLLPLYHELITRFSPDGDRAWFDPASFAWIRDFERGWREIRAEAELLLADHDRLPAFTDVEPGQDDIADERWRALLLRVYGRDVPENCARCPRTAALIRAVPEMTTAMFSVLEPGARLSPHHGPFKGVLRYHLGLLVPQAGRCEIRVKDGIRRWEEGASLVFDDTFEHEAWNETDSRRVVLFADFVRPLPAPLALANSVLLSAARWTPAVRKTRANARRIAVGAALR